MSGGPIHSGMGDSIAVARVRPEAACFASRHLGRDMRHWDVKITLIFFIENYNLVYKFYNRTVNRICSSGNVFALKAHF